MMRHRVVVRSGRPSRVQQSFKSECDINNVMAKYRRTGYINFSRDISEGKYLDLSSVGDFQTSMNKVIAAQNAFESLPSQIRNYFRNDPAEFLEFVGNPANAAKAAELGLVRVPVGAATPPADTSEKLSTPKPDAAAAGSIKDP